MATPSNRQIERIPTGIAGLDEVLEGGLPRGRAILISGATGTCKTLFLNEFLYRGITECGENGVFVTFEETPEDIMRNVSGFGWNYPALMRRRKLAFVDISPSDESLEELGPDYNLEPLVVRILHAAGRVQAKRVAIDTLGALFNRLKNTGEIRSALCRLACALKAEGLTTMISSEKHHEEPITQFGVEEFVSDGVMELTMEYGEQSFVRTLYIRKLRGVGYHSGKVQFEVHGRGITVFPKIPQDRFTAKTSFAIRKKFGVPAFDRALGGGIPQGHTMLVTGNTGTGKTMLALQFLWEGFRRGEKGIYVAMEESVPQLKKSARAHGWDLDRAERRGLMRFVTVGLIDVSSDALLYDIVNTVKAMGAKRVAFDSISSLMSATMREEEVRQFLIQLSGFFKTRGVTSVFTYLTSGNFGADRGQLLASMNTNEMRLSSVMDGVLLLLYVERNQRVEKLLNILKLRGSNHRRDIFHYEIGRGGMRMGEKFGA